VKQAARLAQVQMLQEMLEIHAQKQRRLSSGIPSKYDQVITGVRMNFGNCTVISEFCISENILNTFSTDYSLSKLAV
jgi:hypothetical protein